MTTSGALSYRRSGAGQPLLLVHGIGHRRQMWEPLLDLLGKCFDTIAVDLPGFGESSPLPSGQEPTPMRLADSVESLMHEVGWDTAHLVGNSLGGWVALELARRGRARSTTALMPAGLWRQGHGSDSPRHRLMFTVWRALAHLPGAAGAVRNPVVRTLALAGAFGRPWKIPPEVAAGDVLNLRRCDMSRTMQALAGERFTGGQTMTAPLTVVLGGRDPLIRRRHLDLAQLPPQTAVIRLPGAGHVPTWDDPDAVASAILDTAGLTRRAAMLSARPGDVLPVDPMV